jgi:hypothetical protein
MLILSSSPFVCLKLSVDWPKLSQIVGLTLIGNDGSQKKFDDLRDMFVANVNNERSVPDGKGVFFFYNQESLLPE